MRRDALDAAARVVSWVLLAVAALAVGVLLLMAVCYAAFLIGF